MDLYSQNYDLDDIYKFSDVVNTKVTERKNDYTTIVGMLVGVLAMFQVYSYVSGSSKRNPQIHTGGLILGYALVIPYILRLSLDLYSQSIQVFVTLLIVVLDWFSFHEDKSRFSEEELCVVGNCRFSARVTGHLAHIIDTIAMGLMIIPLVDDENTRYAICLGLFIYMLVGIKVIEDYTKDGSVSDLRGKTEEEKCRQARIMRDPWRGGLNDIITALGILLAWQSFFTCTDGRCDTKYFPANQVGNIFTDLSKEHASKKLFMLTIARVIIIDFGMAIVPTYVNYINTSYQHGRIPSEEYGIPSCFDD
tara:strand:- start:109 stop:1029 length:921 start_codon:yes stop_codon:yes gene_type:complete